MKNLYVITMPDNTVRFVNGKGRQSACMKLIGMRVKAALELGQILAIVKLADLWQRHKHNAAKSTKPSASKKGCPASPIYGLTSKTTGPSRCLQMS